MNQPKTKARSSRCYLGRVKEKEEKKKRKKGRKKRKKDVKKIK